MILLLAACGRAPEAIPEPMPQPLPEPSTSGDVPAVGEAADGAIKRLADAGFAVTAQAEVHSGALGWSPDVAGRALTVEDHTRKISYTEPYSDKPAEDVYPSIEIDLFALQRFESHSSQVVRQQPAGVFGAFGDVIAFTPQFSRADSLFTEKVRRALVGGPEQLPGENILVADSHDGVYSQNGPPGATPAGLPDFARCVLWTDVQGADVTSVVVPR